MKFEKGIKNEVDEEIAKSEMFCKALDILNIVSIATLQRLFHIGYPTAESLLKNLLVNGVVEQDGEYYKILNKNQFAHICHLYDIDSIYSSTTLILHNNN